MHKKLDPHTLFSLFEKGDEEIYKEHGQEEVLKNPYVLMGMVVKGLENFYIMDGMYSRTYGKSYTEGKPRVRYEYFNKLYTYLTRINLDSIDTVYSIGESFQKGEVDMCLNHLRKYFEKIEEYEKCAVLMKYIKYLNKPVEIVA